MSRDGNVDLLPLPETGKGGPTGGFYLGPTRVNVASSRVNCH